MMMTALLSLGLVTQNYNILLYSISGSIYLAISGALVTFINLLHEQKEQDKHIVTEETFSLEKLTLTELKLIAKENKVIGYTKMSKKVLIANLQGVDYERK
jgi:hypothetical protein